MGIKNLSSFLRKQCPGSFTETHLSYYQYKKIAVDTSVFLYKYKIVFGDNWLSSFINLIACLRRNDIHCIFIFDGEAPVEKTQEKQKRSDTRDKIKNKSNLLQDSLDNYYKNDVIDDVIKDVYSKEKGKVTRLLNNKEKINIKIVEGVLQKWQSQVVSFSKEDMDKTKELFKILKIPYYTAPTEAETFCSQLCVKGLVDAVLSEDTDVLVYGTPLFLTKIDTYNDTCIEVSYKNILEELEFTPEQFKDMCIMCGCDYNTNIPKIGSVNAFKLIKEFSTIENVGEIIDEKTKTKKYDISVLNHIRVREIFSIPDKMDLNIPYVGITDFNELEKFILVNNCRVNLEKIKSSFLAEIIIE